MYRGSSNPFNGSSFVLEQETLPSFFSTGWFQEQIRTWFNNQATIQSCKYKLTLRTV